MNLKENNMDKNAAIRDMMSSMAQGKHVEVQDKFNDIMNTRAGEALNDYKSELSKTVFKNQELVGMGLADGEERISEVDPSATPIPVEGIEYQDENV